MEVKVLKIIPITGWGNLRGLALVRIGPITIRGFRVIQQPDQRAWVAPPQREIERDGRKVHFPIVELPRDVKQVVQHKVLERWRTEVSE